LEPVTKIFEMVSRAVPGFCTATDWTGLAVPTAWAGNASADDENESKGASGETVN
jgi:hypothetical protein